MNKGSLFFSAFFAWLTGFMMIGGIGDVHQQPKAPAPIVQPPPPPITPPAPPPAPVEPDCVGVQVPIPKDCRVFNKSGSQCVWCSIECLGRYHKVRELYEGDRRLTLKYTWATGPAEVQRVLSSNYPTVKWKQVQSKSELRNFIKTYVTEKKFGVGIGIPGHMLNLVHYDEQAKVVKVIDNCGPKALQVQYWSMDKFDRLADGWVLTVFPPGYVETSADAFDCTLTDPFKLYYGWFNRR